MRSSLAAACVLISAVPAIALERQGFEASHDEAMVQELSNRGLDALLDHYLQASGAGQEQQAGMRAMVSVRRLLREGEQLPDATRRQLVGEIVVGAQTILPSIQDPQQLMQLAAALITSGMERTANTIEYWGESPRAQAELRPLAELVAQVLEACEARATQQAEALVARFGNTPSQAQLKQYSALDNLATTAAYTRNMADYYRAMSLPKADPQRAQIADAAIAALAEYDTPESQIQALVRLRIGKLQMVKGAYAEAKEMFASVSANPQDAIKPAPDALQQYEARYFAIVADLLAGSTDAVEGEIGALEQWQEANLPADEAVRRGAEASLEMLRYRFEIAKAQTAQSAQDKAAAQARANDVLQRLAESRPELRGVVYEQLVKSLPQDVAVSELDPLMLRALVQQAMSEVMREDGQPFDRSAIERGIAAATQLLSKPGDTSAAVLDDVAIVMPQLLEKLGRDQEAAEAYLAYVQTSKNETNRPAALNNALAAIARLKGANAEAAQVQKLQDVALPLAVTQFSRREFTYELARRLHEKGEYREAIAMYRAVPRNDPRALIADFHRMEAMKQELDRSGTPTQEAREEIRRLAQELTERATEARASAKDESGKTRAGLINARAQLMLATLAKDAEPARAVKVLEGFDEAIAGLPGADDMQAEALFIRIDALMASGRNDEATTSLLELLQGKAAEQGAAIIFSLLKRLDEDLDVAQRVGDTVRAKSLLDARAALSGPLVQWARGNTNERIRKYTYQYMVFDAATRQQAAMAEPEGEKRTAALRETLSLYDALLNSEGIKLWRETVDPAKVDIAYGDVAVLFAKAQVLFELGDYQEAAKRFGRLLEDRKLGLAQMVELRDGEMQSRDNPQYWEATYKLYRSNLQLAREPGATEQAKLLQDTASGLKRLYIREGEGVGGEKWKKEFEALRRELIPEWQ